MAFRMQQFRCKKCGCEFEELLDSRTPDQEVVCPGTHTEFVHPSPDPKVIGTRIESGPCLSKNVERILAVGSGKGGHVSWSKWRV